MFLPNTLVVSAQSGIVRLAKDAKKDIFWERAVSRRDAETNNTISSGESGFTMKDMKEKTYLVSGSLNVRL